MHTRTSNAHLVRYELRIWSLSNQRAQQSAHSNNMCHVDPSTDKALPHCQQNDKRPARIAISDASPWMSLRTCGRKWLMLSIICSAAVSSSTAPGSCPSVANAQSVLAISCGLKCCMVAAAVAAAASMSVAPGWCRSVANAQAALLMSCGTQRGRSVSSCAAGAAQAFPQTT